MILSKKYEKKNFDIGATKTIYPRPENVPVRYMLKSSLLCLDCMSDMKELLYFNSHVHFAASNTMIWAVNAMCCFSQS
jgi:hypothetical protein